MRVLFLARHQGYFRNYDSVIRLLAARGHAIHLAVEREDQAGGTALVDRLMAECQGVTFGFAPARLDDEWAWIAGRLRLGLDFLRYQHPTFDAAYQLRARARERTPGAFVELGRLVRVAGDWSRRLVASLVRRLERAVPEDAGIRRYIESARPDLVLITPLIDLGSSQIDYLRAARAMSIPTALGVWSWDHLSSKALIREAPDRVFVWNDTQKREAVALHGVAADRIVVTGAQCFDQWFERQPSRSREAFCAERGFDPVKPIVLYVCSALFAGSPVEAVFVHDWLSALRRHAGLLRDANVLVRPHPSRTGEWNGVDVRALGGVVWGRSPVDAEARADYFDSLYHADAVVGINTSAFIEAGIVGRPVLALTLPEFAANQAGTVHFDYLTSVGGGLLTAASDMQTHLGQLADALARPRGGPSTFVEAFVRPRGLTTPATPYFVEQVEALAAAVPMVSELESGAFWRWAVGQLARTQGSQRLERWTLSWRERESVEHGRDELQRKALERAAARAGADTARATALRERANAFERLRRTREESRRQREAQWAARDQTRAASRQH